MKKRFDKAMILTMAAVLSASALSACGTGAAETKAAQTTAARPETVSGETGEETKAEEAETYVELQPVSKWGYIADVDEASGDITFNSNELLVDENGEYKDTTSEIILKTTANTPVLDGTTLAPVAMSEIDTAQPV